MRGTTQHNEIKRKGEDQETKKKNKKDYDSFCFDHFLLISPALAQRFRVSKGPRKASANP